MRRVATAGLAAVLVMSGCGHSGARSGSGALGAGATASAPATASAAAGTGNLGAGPGAGATSTQATQPPAQNGPQIVSFKVAKKPSCPVVGTSAAPYSAPGQPVSLSWKVTGASGVALSIDDPNFYQTHHTGGYGNYGAEGNVTLYFACGDTTKQWTTHTYTINTLGSPSKARTLTVTVQTQP